MFQSNPSQPLPDSEKYRKLIKYIRRRLIYIMKAIADMLTRRGIRAYYVYEKSESLPFVLVPLESILNAIIRNVPADIRPALRVDYITTKFRGRDIGAIIIYTSIDELITEMRKHERAKEQSK